MNWAINDNIVFIPGKKQLVSLTKPELNVTLTTPASRCLMLLLEAAPEIVLQQELFTKVWEDEGMLVPTNTLYQNISIVRRGLRTVGESDTLIIATVPRKGFQIDSSVKITSISDDPFPEPMDKPALTEKEDNNQQTELSFEPESEPPDPHSQTSDKNKKNQQGISWFITSAGLTLITVLISALLIIYAKHIKIEKSFFANYTLNGVDNKCRYYSKDDSHDGKFNFEKFKEMIKKTGLRCDKYSWIYFPALTSAPTLTALACKQEYSNTDTPGCISLYFMEMNHE